MKFSKKEVIRFKHVDFAGIVFYPRFLEMLNDLVEDWFGEELDRPFSKIHDSRQSRTGRSQSNGIPTVDLKVQFKKPARIGDELVKSLWVKNVGGASVTCGFEFRHSDESVCLEGEVTLVNVGLDKQSNQIKAVAFDDATRARIETFKI